MARFKRLDGHDVFLLTGTDEHGQKVEQAARAAGLDPQTYADQVSADFLDMTAKMGVTNDDWIRTTEARHKLSCAELWRRIAANGHIYLGHYEGWYAVRDEAFYHESDSPSGRTEPRWDHPARRSPGCASRRISSTCRNGRTSCWQLYESQLRLHPSHRRGAQ